MSPDSTATDALADPADARALSTQRLKRQASAPRLELGKRAGSELRSRKLGEVIAYAIKRDIAELGWPVGHVLGSQAELMQRYGVGRATLREAIRQVERHGVAHMRSGLNGGLVIQQPARDAAVLALAAYLELAGVRLPELFEVRQVLEDLMIALACERADDAGLRQLSWLLAELDAVPVRDLDRNVALSFRLRGAMVALSRNPALGLLLDVLYRVTSDFQTAGVDDPELPGLLAAARREKFELIEAIVAADAVQAQLLARASLQRSRERAEQRLRDLGHGIDGAGVLSLAGAGNRFGGVVQKKLGHRISLRIAQDAAALRPGERLGSEAQLCARHDVSRAVLREALRTLELHAIVRSQRGFGGGLSAGVADPAYTVELASIYFQYARLKPRHFYELWRALQTAAAPLAAARMAGAGRAQLLAALEEEARAPADALLPVQGQLHALISALSGNRVLTLFARVMDDVGKQYPTAAPGAEQREALAASHRDLAGAIARGEAAISRRAMVRHLKLLDTWIAATQ